MRHFIINSAIVTLFLVCFSFADTHIPAGDVYGTWTSSGSPYLIDGEITIPTDSTLTIQPGVNIIFQGHYKFIVHGLLEAIGTESDSIVFTAANTDTGWGGIRFIDSQDSSHLNYCIVEHGNANEYSPDYIGRGIYCVNSNPVLTNCIIQENVAGVLYGEGGGIYLNNSNPTIISCLIRNNSGCGSGGGICCTNSNPIIRNSIISDNSAGFDVGYGGGIYLSNSNAIIEECTIHDNMAGCGVCGGGIYSQYSDPIISNCIISDNHMVYGGGGGIALLISRAEISHCVITGNYCDYASALLLGSNDSCIVSNCTIINNRIYGSASTYGTIVWTGYGGSLINSIVANNWGDEAIHFDVSPERPIIYCDFYNNQGGDFAGSVPTGLGNISITNFNGDSCDVYYNIFLNPHMYANYHLQSTSPCIDAGDPTSPHDPDGTIADMGAFYYPHSGIPQNHSQSSLPTSFQLFQNYPNPFNSITTISFFLPVISKTLLNIYDLTGRHITTLIDNRLDAGIHHFTFDASILSSGIYFYQLQANNFIATKKMVFIK
jgi:hypothetical protein